ncbi:hypothetical protein TRVL_06592 [Trypanosoma vivax]|nr:hypothetical protein TRVL_06592 [Trypanosoma vivax]
MLAITAALFEWSRGASAEKGDAVDAYRAPCGLATQLKRFKAIDEGYVAESDKAMKQINDPVRDAAKQAAVVMVAREGKDLDAETAHRQLAGKRWRAGEDGAEPPCDNAESGLEPRRLQAPLGATGGSLRPASFARPSKYKVKCRGF